MGTGTGTETTPTPNKRLYKEGLSQWAKDIIDAALDSELRVIDYDGVLQPGIYLFPFGVWHKPPFMELAGKELFVKLPYDSDGGTLHFRLECSAWSYPNPDGSGEAVTLLFYAPIPYTKRRGVVDGNVVDVWVEKKPEGPSPIETPAPPKEGEGSEA